MDIEALRSFLAFVDTGSFTRAAKQVHRTQSAISMQMKKLEQAVDKCLFTKQGRLLVLSADGQVFVGYARQLVQLHDDTLKKMHTEEPSTLMRLGCPDDYAESILPTMVMLLHQTFTHLNLQITCAPSHRIKIMLDSGHLDMGIVTRSPGSEEGYLLQTDQGVWVANLQANSHYNSPLPIAVFQSDCRFHHAAIEGLIKQNKAFKLIACTGSASAQRGIVAKGLAIGAMAKASKGYLDELNQAGLPPLPSIEIVCLRASTANNPMSEKTLNTLCQQYLSSTSQIRSRIC